MCSFSDAQTDMEADESAEKLSCVKNSLNSAPTCAPSTASLRHPAAFMESHCPLSLADQFDDIRRADSHHPSSTENQWSSSSICSTYYSNDFCWREAGKKGMVTNCCGFIRYMCVRLHMWCQTSLQPALIFCSNTMVSQLEGQFTPKSKDVRLLFSVMELDGCRLGCSKHLKKTQLCLFREITTWFLEIIHRPWTIFFPYHCTDGSVHLLIRPPARLRIQLSKWNDFYLINAVR